MCPAFIDSILTLSGRNGTCLCDCVITWLRDIIFFKDATLNSPGQVDTFIYLNHVSSNYKSSFSSKLMLNIQPQLSNTEHEMITFILKVV